MLPWNFYWNKKMATTYSVCTGEIQIQIQSRGFGVGQFNGAIQS